MTPATPAAHAPDRTAEQLQATVTRWSAAALLGDGEIVIFAIKPSLWTVLFVSARWLAVLATVLAAVVLFRDRWPWQYSTTQLIVAVCLVLMAARLMYGWLQWFSRTYILTNRRVLRIRGVIRVDVFESPLTRIQNTFLTFSLVERLFGLGSIAFTTAGTGSIEAIWRHCRNPIEVHRRLIDAINKASNRPEP